MEHKQGSNVVFSFLQEIRQKKGNPYVFPDSFTWAIDTQGGAQDVQLVSSKEFTTMACHFFPYVREFLFPAMVPASLKSADLPISVFLQDYTTRGIVYE
jgi:hypothetical protein